MLQRTLLLGTAKSRLLTGPVLPKKVKATYNCTRNAQFIVALFIESGQLIYVVGETVSQII